MITVRETLKTILESVRVLEPETVRLDGAFGRVLSRDVYSALDIPGMDNSAMDGYAVTARSTAGVSGSRPCRLEVIEDVRAGYVPKESVADGLAIRIMTGAPIPQGADAVVPVEQTRMVPGEKEGRELVEIVEEARPGQNVRRAGEDIRRGELVIEKGARLRPAHVGVLASLGTAEVEVTRKPRVAVLATGDEVVEPGRELGPGRLYSSNSYTLSGQVLGCGGVPKDLGIAADEPAELEKKLRAGLDCDLIVASGGVSVGKYDFVKAVLARMGTSMKLWQIAMRPGKPLAFGIIAGKPVFGLPGNPVSSMVSFEVLVRPALMAMLGQKIDDRLEVGAVLEEDIVKKKGFRYFLRGLTRWTDGRFATRTTGPQGSGILKSMALANSLIILPEEGETFRKGDMVTVRFLD